MTPSFEQRRDVIHESILSGGIGCPFAKVAAENDEIAYCPSPDTIDSATISTRYIEAIQEFAYDTTKKILIALPEKSDRVTEDDAKLYAQQLFPETVSSMRFATRNIVDLLLTEGKESDADLYEILEANPMHDRKIIFDYWAKNARNLSNSMPTGGMVTPYLLRHSTRKIEEIFAFTMDPSYTPVRSLPHPRHSPHFALIMNYRNDLQQSADASSSSLVATRNWMQAAVGYQYSQGYRISQTPRVISDETSSNDWHPRD